MKKKLIIGLLLIAQVRGVMALEKDMVPHYHGPVGKELPPFNTGYYQRYDHTYGEPVEVMSPTYDPVHYGRYARRPVDINSLVAKLSPQVRAEYYKLLETYQDKSKVAANAGYEKSVARQALSKFERLYLFDHAAAPKSEGELLREYKVYVANSNPYTALYRQKAAGLKRFNAELTALKKSGPTNTRAIKELEERIAFLNSYDPGRDQQLRPIMSFDRWKEEQGFFNR